MDSVEKIKINPKVEIYSEYKGAYAINENNQVYSISEDVLLFLEEIENVADHSINNDNINNLVIYLMETGILVKEE